MPKTIRGQELILAKLQKLAPDDPDTQRKIIEQSVERSWAGVFPIRDEKMTGFAFGKVGVL
jgi:hypothetical protein